MTTNAREAMAPLRPGIFEMPDSMDGTPLLIGQRCTACREMFMGSDHYFCPNCSSDAMERATLSPHGEVYTYTTVYQKLKGSLVEAPYVMARVRLPEGVTVQTILTDVEPDHVKVGMPVQICLKKLTDQEDGSALVNFFFRPRDAA